MDMKIFNWVFVILFLLFAALQYNDPDPIIWMSIYLYAAFLCYLSAKGAFKWRLFFAAILLFVPYAMYIFFRSTGALYWLMESNDSIASSMKAGSPWIENAREFFGLVIVLIVLCMNAYVDRAKLNHKKLPQKAEAQ
jgi:hypothetical protein